LVPRSGLAERRGLRAERPLLLEVAREVCVAPPAQLVASRPETLPQRLRLVCGRAGHLRPFLLHAGEEPRAFGEVVGVEERLDAGDDLFLSSNVGPASPLLRVLLLRNPPQQPVPRLGEALDPRCTALRPGHRAEVAERRVGRVKLAPARARLACLRAGELLHPSAQRLQPLHVLRLALRPVLIGFPPALPEALLGRGESPCQGVCVPARGQRWPARFPASRESLPRLRRRHGRRLGERLGLLDEHLELAAGRVGRDPLPRSRREPFAVGGEATAQLAPPLLGHPRTTPPLPAPPTPPPRH